jgi:ABC-type Mn2+/Zn2+ transport system permease subunit
LLIGWVVSLIGGIAGLYLSFYGDFPSGAAIVCTLGALLVLVAAAGALRSKRDPDRPA